MYWMVERAEASSDVGKEDGADRSHGLRRKSLVQCSGGLPEASSGSEGI